MSATETKPQPSETNLTTKLPYYQINPSYTVRVICCVVFIFLTEICLAHYVYRLIKSETNDEYVSKINFHQEFINELRSTVVKEEINRILKEINYYEQSARNFSRKKREALLIDEENLLNLPKDGPNVEFFSPKIRSELEAKDELERQKTGQKGAAPGGDSWVWLTSYSRIPEITKVPSELCILDWQLARIGSPALDLGYFIFTGTSKELRDEHYKSLIEQYYDSFSSSLRELGSDPDKLFPFDVLQEHLKKYSVYGLYMAILVLIIIISDTEEIPDIHNVASNENVMDKFNYEPKNLEIYNARIRGIVLDFVKLGYNF